MKAVILAGGLGTRLMEETRYKPKPMVEVGGYPLLWHIMKIYSHYGINDFVICLGYKGEVIKDYFYNYKMRKSDFRIDLQSGSCSILQSNAEDWKISLVDTGDETMTGGRLKRVREYLGDETFCFTYGDGLSDIDIAAELAFHRHHGRAATVATIRQPSGFGVLASDENGIATHFVEKPLMESARINGGFFILEPSVLNYISGDSCVWEDDPMKKLVANGELAVFEHKGFWKACDTLRDKDQLEKLWVGKAPWRVWDRNI